jgi:N-acetylmuramoyl-L-alanine amidase
LIGRIALLRCAPVARLRVRFAVFIALTGAIGCLALYGQTTDEEKREKFLKARASPTTDESSTPTPKPKSSAHKKKSPTPAPKPRKKKTAADESATSPTPSETPEATAKPKKSATKEAISKSKKKKKASPGPEKSPTPHKRSSAKSSETPPVGATASPPRAIAVPSPNPPPPPLPRSTSTMAAPVEEPEQLTIEKYGYEKPKGFWARLFGGGGRRSSSSGAGYRYLTRSVRDQIDRAPVARSRWQFIVVHNSGTRQGNAAAFDYYHRHIRRMQNGLAYHFVIGNGTSTGNGQVEVGDRWRRQINGGHVHSDYLNNIALGICLVGDFNRDQPTRAQLDCCEELIRYLRQRCGKVGDHYPIVKPHREMNPPRWPTDCPGDVFPYSWFRRFQE